MFAATKVKQRCLSRVIGPEDKDKYPPRCTNDAAPWKWYCITHLIEKAKKLRETK